MEIQGLNDLQRDLLNASRNAQRQMPKLMRKVGSKARVAVAKKSRTLVKKKTGNYQKGWKRGKVFVGYDGALTIRVYNGSPHAHLIEDGHRMVSESGEDLGIFVHGKKVLKKGMQEFDASGVPQKMMSDWLDDLLEQNRL
ncbi:MAG: HK97 gp10 family phage protein [Lysinibacillus sp.]